MNLLNKIKRRLTRAIYAFISTLKDEVTHYPASVLLFEDSFKSKFGSKYAVSFSNGTGALEAAMFAAKIRNGDEVIIPSYSFHSGAAAILCAGATPVYIDNEKDTLSPSIESYISMINSKTKAILILHPWGFPYDFRDLVDICKKKGITIIEDCSHSHGAMIGSRYVGTIGDIGCFSLQGYKSISAGEGGICITDEMKLNDRLKLFGHFGRDYDGEFNDLKITGFGKKYRANPLGLSIARYDLDRIHIENSKRNTSFAALTNHFSRSRYFKTFPIKNGNSLGGHYQGFPLLVDDELIEKYGSIENIINFFFDNDINCMHRPLKPLDSIDYLLSVDSYVNFFYEDNKINKMSSTPSINAYNFHMKILHFPLEQFSSKSKHKKLIQTINKI
jgi:dTDP-4-amino-4,6-dideoxygalactose transaminase